MTTAPSTDSESGRLRAVVDGFPTDLLTISTVAVVLFWVLLGTETGYSWPRALVGLVFVLVLPGYALVSAIFPGRPTGSLSRPRDDSAYSPGTAERFGLSFAFSLALLPLLAVAHGFFGVPFETGTVVGSVALLVVGLSVVGVVRRLLLAPIDRYDPPSPIEQGARVRDWLAAGTAIDSVLSVALAAAVLLAVGALAFGLTGPTQGEAYTSVSLVTQGDGGEFVASNYPTNLTAGESRNLTLQIENNYQSAGDYTAVVELQRVNGEDDGSIDVVERERLGTFETELPANETWTHTHAVEPTMTGSDLRLIYYVYRGDVPETPTVENAEGTVYLRVTVR